MDLRLTRIKGCFFKDVVGRSTSDKRAKDKKRLAKKKLNLAVGRWGQGLEFNVKHYPGIGVAVDPPEQVLTRVNISPRPGVNNAVKTAVGGVMLTRGVNTV